MSLFFLVFQTGCASYQNKMSGTHSLLKSGQALSAASALKQAAFTDGNDQVANLLEYATALQIAGDLEGSIKAFLLAEELTEVKDYHSLSRITGSLLLSERLMQYKGEDYEKVLINVFLAINFLVQGKIESAAVEARKVNEKLRLYRTQAKRKYEQNPFAFYLSALTWEADKKWDSAYIDLKRAYELNPNVDYFKEDLMRIAQRSRRPKDLKKWKGEFPGVKLDESYKDSKKGELILIYQQGWGPIKKPHPSWPRIPKLFPRSATTQKVKLQLVGGGAEQSQKITSVQDVAIKSLDTAYAGLIAKRIAGVATKAVVADQIGQKNKGLGQLAWIAMNLADQADTRQWSTLPASIQIAKMYLPVGQHRVRVIGLNGVGIETGEASEDIVVDIRPRKRTFIQWRSFR